MFCWVHAAGELAAVYEWPELDIISCRVSFDSLVVLARVVRVQRWLSDVVSHGVVQGLQVYSTLDLPNVVVLIFTPCQLCVPEGAKREELSEYNVSSRAYFWNRASSSGEATKMMVQVACVFAAKT